MEIFLIRHAESIGNTKGINYGQKIDYPLSELGIVQSELLKERLSKIKFDAIYSSDLKRAVETAEIISPKNLKINYDKRLRERNFGIIADKKDLLKNWKEYVKKEMENKNIQERDVVPLEGESDKNHFDRVKEFFNELLSKHSCNEKIIIVGHGGTNKVVMGVIGYLSEQKMYKLPQGNTCVNKILFNDNKWTVKYVNDIDHLPIHPDLISQFKKIRDEPLNVLNNTCFEKHIKFKNVLDRYGYLSKYQICSFRWSNQNLPKEILNLEHEDLDYHLSLKLKLNGLKMDIDLTNDSQLPSFNTWNGKNSCKLAVVPNEIIENDIDNIIKNKLENLMTEDQKVFLKEVNKHLDKIRKQH